jgi:hypothetical protein
MFLDQPEGTKEKMSGNQHHPDQVGQKGRPETAVNIRENADGDQGESYIKTVLNYNAVKLHSLDLGCKDNLV